MHQEDVGHGIWVDLKHLVTVVALTFHVVVQDLDDAFLQVDTDAVLGPVLCNIETVTMY